MMLAGNRHSEFPSPCGVLVLKSNMKTLVLDESFLFPSPCGVLVLKSIPILLDIGHIRISFRPLAGFWFLNFTLGAGLNMRRTLVSVPLRGSPILASPVATGEVASMRADGGACALRALLLL